MVEGQGTSPFLVGISGEQSMVSSALSLSMSRNLEPGCYFRETSLVYGTFFGLASSLKVGSTQFVL